ncbi:MAG: LuxR C-terminal-related transcriptional regulator [Ignavibacteria bacterium]
MNQEKKSGKTPLLKSIASAIIDSIRKDQGKDLQGIADSIKVYKDANEQLKTELIAFINTYMQRITFSPEEMKLRIDKHSRVFAKHKLFELQARARLLLANHYLATYKHFAECLQELIAVELIAQKHIGLHHMIHCEALFTKGSVYFFQGDLEGSTKAIELAQSLKSFAQATHELHYKSHINLARNYSLMSQFSKLKYHVEMAEKSWVHYQGIYDKAAVYVRRADVLKYEKDWNGAYNVLKEGLEFYKPTQFKLRVAEFHKEIGVLFSLDGNPKKDFMSATQSFEEALKISRELSIARLEAAILMNLWQTALHFQEWKICAERLIEHGEILEKINQEEISIHIKKLEQFEKEEQIKLMSEGKPTYNKAILEEVVKLREDNEELKKKNNQYQKIFVELDSVIERISNSNTIRFSMIQELAKISNKNKRNISTLDAYLSDCEEMHPAFSRTLVQLLPSITPMEMKVAKLIRIGLNTQSIANVCGVTVKSIENHRTKLRKKCNLKPEQSLSTFMATVK